MSTRWPLLLHRAASERMFANSETSSDCLRLFPLTTGRTGNRRKIAISPVIVLLV
jgi:hypothetical protein